MERTKFKRPEYKDGRYILFERFVGYRLCEKILVRDFLNSYLSYYQCGLFLILLDVNTIKEIHLVTKNISDKDIYQGGNIKCEHLQVYSGREYWDEEGEWIRAFDETMKDMMDKLNRILQKDTEEKLVAETEKRTRLLKKFNELFSKNK